MTDTIRLTVPSGRSYQGVVRLVLGGLAAQSGLSVEALEDVQLALDTLLADEFLRDAEILDVEIHVDDGARCGRDRPARPRPDRGWARRRRRGRGRPRAACSTRPRPDTRSTAATAAAWVRFARESPGTDA